MSALSHFWGLLQGRVLLLAAHPGALALYCIPLAMLFTLLLLALHRRQYARALWYVIAMLAIDLFFSAGDDVEHHVQRIVALTAQLHHGGLDPLLTNPDSGAAYPVFVYYSLLPYALPVLLGALGLPPLLSFLVSMALLLVVMGAGLQALLRSHPLSEHGAGLPVTFLFAVLFITATYVDGLWWGRAALGEAWVYALAPWVALALISNPPLAGASFVLLFLQICAHPLVFIHGFIGEVALAFGASQLSLLSLTRRCLLPLGGALVLAAPYWLPQFLWMHDIVGNSILPRTFADSFLYAAELVSPLLEFQNPLRHNLGLCFLLSMLTMVVVARGRLAPRAWLLLAGCAVLMVLQTVHMRWLTTHLPVLNLSQFVWRLMMPVALIGLGALLAGRNAPRVATTRLFTALALLSIASLLLRHLVTLPHALQVQSAGQFDAAGYAKYLHPSNVWGVGLFAPDYARLSQRCPPAASTQNATFSAVHAGLAAERSYVSVFHAPTVLTEYRVNGAAVQPSACGESLVIGPVAAGNVVSVAEQQLDALQRLRIIVLVAGACGAWWWLRRGRAHTSQPRERLLRE
ncbi:MAG: hypothetical protein JO005_04195 [Gammaproteobacteria bacterium]|nr:hypothetical protein [Gammaproteobacteria bacterium]